MLQAYNRRLLRRNVEQSRAIRYPDSASETEERPSKKNRREKPRKHRKPIKNGNQKCLETEIDGHRVLSFQTEKHFEDYRRGKINPGKSSYRVPPLVCTPPTTAPDSTPTGTPTQTQKCHFNAKISKSVDSGKSDDDESPLLEPGNHFIDTDYHPDTESGDSRLSDSTEYFRYSFLKGNPRCIPEFTRILTSL